MVQDTEFPKNTNLNTETNTHFDNKENEHIQPEDSNKTDTITANDQNINDYNKDTDIQNNNEILIDEYETVQDSSNFDPNNDITNTSSTHNNEESADDGLNNKDKAKEDTNNYSDNDDVNNIDNDFADNDFADNDPDYRIPEEEQNLKLRAIQSVQGTRKGKKRTKGTRKVLHYKIILLE